MIITSQLMKRAVQDAFNHQVKKNGKVSSHSQLERWIIQELNRFQPCDSAKSLEILMHDLFSIDFDIQPNVDEQVELDLIVHKAYNVYGFARSGTGGGCEAFTKDFDDAEIVVTCSEGCSVPETLTEPVLVGIQDGGGNSIEHKCYSSSNELLGSDWFQFMINNLK